MIPSNINAHDMFIAYVDKVIDGDTIDATVHLGFGVKRSDRFRLYGPDPTGKMGFNSYELSEPKGMEAKKRLEELISESGNWIWLVTPPNNRREKYGRYLAVLYRFRSGIYQNLNQVMLDEGHAYLKAYSDDDFWLEPGDVV